MLGNEGGVTVVFVGFGVCVGKNVVGLFNEGKEEGGGVFVMFNVDDEGVMLRMF